MWAWGVHDGTAPATSVPCCTGVDGSDIPAGVTGTAARAGSGRSGRAAGPAAAAGTGATCLGRSFLPLRAAALAARIASASSGSGGSSTAGIETSDLPPAVAATGSGPGAAGAPGPPVARLLRIAGRQDVRGWRLAVRLPLRRGAVGQFLAIADRLTACLERRPRLRAVRADFQRKPLLDNVGHFLARRDQLEDAAVDFPVAEPLGQIPIVAKVGDVQAVGEVIEHHAALTAEHTDRPRLVEHLDVSAADFLPPVPGSRLESQLLGRGTGREQDHARLVRANAGFVGRALIAGQQPISHLDQTPSAGRSQTCPSYRAMKSERLP